MITPLRSFEKKWAGRRANRLRRQLEMRCSRLLAKRQKEGWIRLAREYFETHDPKIIKQFYQLSRQPEKMEKLEKQ